jgi:hypothetical protein
MKHFGIGFGIGGVLLMAACSDNTATTNTGTGGTAGTTTTTAGMHTGGSASGSTSGGAAGTTTAGSSSGGGGTGGASGGTGGAGGAGGAAAGSGGTGGAGGGTACKADPGYALQFSGTGDDRVHADITKLPVGKESRTIELWAYFDGTDVSWINERGVFEYGLRAGDATYPGQDCHEFGLNSWAWANGAATGKIHPYGNCPSVDQLFDLPAATPKIGWLHFALGYDGPNNHFQFTINGVKMTNGSYHPDADWKAAANWNSTKSPLRIGTTDEFKGPPGWQGKIDELRVWNVFRTEAEIKANMKVILKGNEPGLVAYYKFDENTGQSSADATGDASNAAKFIGADKATWPMWTKSDIPGPFTCAP